MTQSTIPASAVPGEAVQQDTPWKEGRATACVLALATVVRSVWALVVPIVPVSDQVAYDTFARHLAAGQCFGWQVGKPTAFWPVGAPFMYSLVYRLFPPDRFGYAAVAVLNLVLGVLLVWLTMLLANRWFGKRVAIWAGVVMALWPIHVQFTTIIASETIFTVLLLGAMLAWPAHSRRMVGRLIGAGVLFAAATYVRPTALLVPVVLGVARVLLDKQLFGAIRRLGIVYATMALVIVPWTLRNVSAFGHPVLISDNGGPNLWMGNNPESEGFYQEPPPAPPDANEAEYNAELGREAVAFIRAQPVSFVKRTAIKSVRLYERETIGVGWNGQGLERIGLGAAIQPLKLASWALYLGILGAALVGAGLLVRSLGWWRAALHPTLSVIAYFTAVHAVIVIQDRYHFPVTPLIGALAAVAGVYFVDRWNARKGAASAQ